MKYIKEFEDIIDTGNPYKRYVLLDFFNEKPRYFIVRVKPESKEYFIIYDKFYCFDNDDDVLVETIPRTGLPTIDLFNDHKVNLLYQSDNFEEIKKEIEIINNAKKYNI